jgi:hypothetical protein
MIAPSMMCVAPWCCRSECAGIATGIAQDFVPAPAHAHLNLVCGRRDGAAVAIALRTSRTRAYIRPLRQAAAA